MVANQDCLAYLKEKADHVYDLVFADPPFNINFAYDVYKDKLPAEQYVAWCEDWMQQVYRTLTPTGTFWLAIGDEFAAELKLAAQRVGFICRSWVVSFSTFGVNVEHGFTRSHSHLFHFIKNEKSFVFNSADPRLRQPSARQLIYKDKRADSRGRLPDNTWILRPQEIPEVWTPDIDTWTFPRICGTFKERCKWHPCQMPIAILERIVLFSSHPGQMVFDPFVGSGTTGVACKKVGRLFEGTELSEAYARRAAERIESFHVED